MEDKFRDSVIVKFILIMMICFFIYMGLFFALSDYQLSIRIIFSVLPFGLCLFFSISLINSLLTQYAINENYISIIRKNRIKTKIMISEIIGMYYESDNGTTKLTLFSDKNQWSIPYSGRKLKIALKSFIEEHQESIALRAYAKILEEGINVKDKKQNILYKIDDSGVFIAKTMNKITWSEIADVQIASMNGLKFYTFKGQEKIQFSDFHISGNLGFVKYVSSKVGKSV